MNDTPSHLVSPGVLARELGLSVVRVRQLATAGRIPFVLTPGGHRRFDLAAVQDALSGEPDTVWHQELDREGLAEDQVWREISAALPPMTSQALTVAEYAVTEMVNNAIDHSEGSVVGVIVRRSGAELTIVVRDDGVGVFTRLCRTFNLPHPASAAAELTKGKRTSDPAHHSGEGIFFTSKAVDVFELAGDGIVWIVDNTIGDHALGDSPVTTGTQVTLKLRTDGERALSTVFASFGHDRRFTRSQPAIRLFEIGSEFVSRSEAKRLLAGMESFETITLDFAGVTAVGQGFVDEVFRVWPSQHRHVAIAPVNMGPAVQFMIERGLAR